MNLGESSWVLISSFALYYSLEINEFFSSFPNAVSLKPVEGPDYRPINYFNIIFLTLFAALVYGLWVRWRRFRRARIDPVLEDIEDRFDAAGDAVQERGGRLRRWLGGK